MSGDRSWTVALRRGAWYQPRPQPRLRSTVRPKEPTMARSPRRDDEDALDPVEAADAVSYTHLTLPTIYSV